MIKRGFMQDRYVEVWIGVGVWAVKGRSGSGPGSTIVGKLVQGIVMYSGQLLSSIAMCLPS